MPEQSAGHAASHRKWGHARLTRSLADVAFLPPPRSRLWTAGVFRWAIGTDPDCVEQRERQTRRCTARNVRPTIRPKNGRWIGRPESRACVLRDPGASFFQIVAYWPSTKTSESGL